MSRLLDQRPHYASLPREDELVLVTSVLGASASWLTQAFLREALTAKGSADPGDLGRSVVFVSFTRDWGFHADCVRKLGIDLSQQAQKGRFAFVDGLSKLFSPPGPPAPQTGDAAVQLSAAGGTKGVAASIAKAIKQLSIAGGKPLLILENPDFLLAAVEGVGALDMGDMILGLRELSHSAIVAVNADSAFLHHPRTRLEMEHAAFVVTLAHNAVWTVGLRLLDTGVAKDVSGVIRITRGAVEDRKASGGEVELEIEEKEVLYYVGDGTVEVFDRGQVRA